MGRLDYLERWKSAPSEQSAFFQRIAEGETPKAICKAQDLPYAALMRHVRGTPTLLGEYKAALQAWVEALAHETVEIADATEGTEEAAQVAAAKLRCDTRFRIAAKLFREEFGEDVKPALTLNLSVGDVVREIRELEARLGIGARPALVLEHEPIALPEPVEETQAPI